jgi:glycosyltransferase involved in cell wall biosynthesis
VLGFNRKVMKTPLISVIIPTYNRARLLKETIDSVLKQNFQNFELIVVDDGSTDNTGEILSDYKDHIQVLAQKNKGVSAARNLGISKAKGEFIAFLDSDDLWLPEKLTAQVDFFQSHPDALVCQTEEIWIRNGKRVNPKKRHKKYSGMIFEQSLPLCIVSPSAVMMRKSLFEKVGLFDEHLPACEDYDLWLRISCQYPIYLINTALIIKNGGHEDQLSKTPMLDTYRIQALVKIIDRKLLSNSQQQAAVNELKKKCDIYINGCLKRNRKDEATYYVGLIERYET